MDSTVCDILADLLLFVFVMKNLNADQKLTNRRRGVKNCLKCGMLNLERVKPFTPTFMIEVENLNGFGIKRLRIKNPVAT